MFELDLYFVLFHLKMKYKYYDHNNVFLIALLVLWFKFVFSIEIVELLFKMSLVNWTVG